jgi:hypothetical protein
MRAASNPGNRGHDWVKTRFMIGQPPEALQRDFPTRFFLPARIADNPHIRSEEYLASLANLDAVRRRQLLEGDWDVTRAAIYFAVNGSRSWTTGRATYLASYGLGTTLRPGMAVTGPWGC